jgi:5-methylcytosine-specific restriction enzyme A
MSRREFSAAIRVAVIKRATKGTTIYCESCEGIAKRFQIDHVRPDGLLGEPVLANAMLICEPCWKIKNPTDASAIAKAKRREANHLGDKDPRKQKMPNRGKAPRSTSKLDSIRALGPTLIGKAAR